MTIRIRWSTYLAVALISAAGACEKPEPPALREMRARIEGFAAELCACADVACADRVTAARTAWATSSKTPTNLGPAALRVMEAANVRADGCEARLRAMAPPPSPAVDAGVPADVGPPAIASPAEAGNVLRVARDWAGGDRVARLEVAYVGADGILDAEHGRVEVRFGTAPAAADDPRRRTGAPVTPSAERTTPCVRTKWAATTGWALQDTPCKPVAAPGPRCTVQEVWKRAIAMGAPADALAVLTFETTMNPIWIFVVRDAPRDVNVQLPVPDDCALAVEAPGP